jgi:4-amino-4-deoxy-L-arabinose transferase-like glycosyltransferase
MRTVADCLVAAWSVLNLVLVVAARRAPQVAAVFAGAAVLVGAGLLVSSPAVVVVGLGVSMVAPVLYGQRIVGQNHLSHHLVRGLVVIALAVLYWLS